MKKNIWITVSVILLIIAVFSVTRQIYVSDRSNDILANCDSLMVVSNENYLSAIDMRVLDIEVSYQNDPCKIRPYYNSSVYIKNCSVSICKAADKTLNEFDEAGIMQIRKLIQIFIIDCFGIYDSAHIVCIDKMKAKFMDSKSYCILKRFSEQGIENNRFYKSEILQLKNATLDYCLRTLHNIYCSVPGEDFKFDTVFVVTIPDKRILKKGEIYNADVRLITGRAVTYFQNYERVIIGEKLDPDKGTFITKPDTFMVNKGFARIAITPAKTGNNEYWIVYRVPHIKCNGEKRGYHNFFSKIEFKVE